MATEPNGTKQEEAKDQAIMEEEEEQEVTEKKTIESDVEEAADDAEVEKDGGTASTVRDQEVKKERAISITISSHLSYRERITSDTSEAAAAATATLIDDTTTAATAITDATSTDGVSTATSTSETTYTDAISYDATSTDATYNAETTTDATTATIPQTCRDRTTSTTVSGTSSTSAAAPATSSQQACKGRVTSNTQLLGSTTTSGQPSKATDLSSDSSSQVKDGHEGAKESCNIMGGDWRKVISQRRGATCSVELISKLKPSEMSLERRRAERDFCTGSVFVGQVDAVGMEGECAYTMPHEVVYEGAMHDGRCEGLGTLAYPNEGRVDGTFTHGKLAPSTYTFSDGLVYELQTHWPYCSSETPDRRFQQEIKYSLRPVCTSLKTQLQPTRKIPEGCYDTGDGFYNPKTRCVTSAITGNIIRIPTKSEANWIAKNCRKAWDEPSGFRPMLNENFRHEDVNYAPLLIAQRRRRAELHGKPKPSHA